MIRAPRRRATVCAAVAFVVTAAFSHTALATLSGTASPAESELVARYRPLLAIVMGISLAVALATLWITGRRKRHR